MIKNETSQTRSHLLLLLCAAAVALFYLAKMYSYHTSIAILYNTCTFFITPMLAFLLGRLFKNTKGKSPFYCIGGMLLLFWGQNMFYFWLQVILQKKPAFDFYKNSGSSWLFSAAMIWIIVYYICRYLEEHTPFPAWIFYLLFSAAGLLYGFCPIVNVFGIRQGMAFLPLFLLAQLISEEEFERCRKHTLLLVGSLILVLLILAAMVLKPGIFTKTLSILDGSNPYGLVFTGHPVFGLVLRAGQLLGGLAACLIALRILPGKLPSFLDAAVSRWYALWFFGRPFVLTAVVLSAITGKAAALLLLAVLFILSVTPAAGKAVKKIYDLPRAMGVSVWSRASAFGIYAFVFIFLSSVMWGIFSVSGKSFVWAPDGQKLYFTSLVYTRNYLHQIISTLIHSGQLVIPQWDLSIGQGSSVLSVFKYNPLYFLAVFLPESFMISYYDILVFAGLILTCLGVRLFLKSLKLGSEPSILMASMLYTFSGYTLVAMRHLIFIYSFIMFLPYLLWACERFLQKRKAGSFVAIVFLIFVVAGYYGAWINTFVMAIYLFFRSVCLHKTKILLIIKDLGQLILLYVWGFLLAAFAFIPSISNFFSSSRTSITQVTRFSQYPEAYYLKMITNFISGTPEIGNWTQLAFPAIVFLAVVVLFFKHKDKLKARIFRCLLFCLIGCLCIPLVGSISNGFGYVTNRWCFGLALLMAALVAFVMPGLMELTFRQKIILSLVTVLYAGLVIYLTVENNKRVSMIGMTLLALTLLFVLLLNRMKNKVLAQELMVLSLVLALSINIIYYLSPEALDSISQYVYPKTLVRYSERSSDAVASDIDDNSVYRCEVVANNKNIFVMTGGNGTSRYVSTISSDITQYHLDFGLNSVRNAYSIWGLDGRTSLTALSSVKYYVCKDAQTGYIPYGYEKVAEDRNGTTLDVYENKYALPIGYCYDSYITNEEYYKMSPLERQQALLQSAMIYTDDTEDLSGLQEGDPELTTVSVPYEVVDTYNMKLTDTTMDVGTEDTVGRVTLAFKGLPDSETYVSLNNPTAGAKAIIKVYSDELNTVKTGKLFASNSQYYFEREALTYNMGHSEDGLTTCTIEVKHRGHYTFDSLQVLCQPMSDYVEDVTKLKENSMTNVKEITNGISGEIDVDEEKLLLLDVPYTKTWTVLVDGEKSDYVQANNMYVGVMLKPGHHSIVMTYQIPGLKLGLEISAACLAITILVFMIRQAGKLKKKKA